MTNIEHGAPSDDTASPPGAVGQEADRDLKAEESAPIPEPAAAEVATHPTPVPETPAPVAMEEEASGEPTPEPVSQPNPSPEADASPLPAAEPPPYDPPAAESPIPQEGSYGEAVVDAGSEPEADSDVSPDGETTEPPPSLADDPVAAGGDVPEAAPDLAAADISGPASDQPAAAPSSPSDPSPAESGGDGPESAEGPPAIKARSVSSLPDDIGPEDFESAIAETVPEFKDGDIIEGRVVNISQDEVLVDIGYKSEGVVPLRELSIRKNVPPSEVVEMGQVIEVLVLEKEDEDGRLILSMKRAQYERAWGRIEGLRTGGETVKGVVIEVVKGGLIVDIGLRGFLPASLIDLRRVRDLDQFVNQEIEAKVIELDRNRNNVVLSRRAHLEEEKAEQRTAFMDNLKEGEVREGSISSVVAFGAFVDLGGMDGLVHVSELSWQHVNHPSEVVKVGENVTVKVLEIDRERTRISLSIKQTTEDPWQAFVASTEVGVVLEGTVIKTVPFGAFVSVGHGVEGLVHVSEIAMHRVESPEMELSIGQNVTVKLTELDEARRRASFSIKQALPNYSPSQPSDGPRPPRRHAAPPKVREFESEDKGDEEEPKAVEVDASLEEILQELKERGIGR